MGFLAPIGRLLFAAIFITSGLNHFMQYPAMVGYARSVGLPMPDVAILGTGVLLVVGGLCVMFGAFARLASAGLAAFLLASAFMVHKFWTIPDPMRAQEQMVHFMKNLSMAGAALFIVARGPGPFSLRRRREDRSSGLGLPMRHRHA
jgi:putative oxidoreductase